MVSSQDLQREALENSFREFCERLRQNDGLGLSLRPSRLVARGSAITPGQNIQDLSGEEFDKRSAGELLSYVEKAKRDFPAARDEYFDVLTKAESTWGNLVE